SHCRLAFFPTKLHSSSASASSRCRVTVWVPAIGWTEMIRSHVRAFTHKMEEPAEADPHRATDFAQSDSLQQYAFTQHTLFIRDHAIFWKQNKACPHALPLWLRLPV